MHTCIYPAAIYIDEVLVLSCFNLPKYSHHLPLHIYMYVSLVVISLQEGSWNVRSCYIPAFHCANHA